MIFLTDCPAYCRCTGKRQDLIGDSSFVTRRLNETCDLVLPLHDLNCRIACRASSSTVARLRTATVEVSSLLQERLLC